MKTKTCDICGKTTNVGYIFWSELTTPEPYDYDNLKTIDICSSCFRDYVWPAIIAGRETERKLKKGGLHEQGKSG